MRVLRFLQPARSAPALNPAGPTDALGLDAFATETPAHTAAATPQVSPETLVTAVLVLAALVVLEAIPAILWLRSQFAPAAPSIAVAAPAIVPTVPPAEAATAAACPPGVTPASGGAPVAAAAAAVPQPAPRPAAPGMVAGLVAVSAPVPMHVYADGRLVGTSGSEGILLPIGEYDLELVSDATGFRARRAVAVQAGRTSSISLEAPLVPVHINAIPWAEVWVDNQRVGETPLGNLQQTIGSHEVVFRHPELGERRMTVTVTMKEPARISMDMRKR